MSDTNNENVFARRRAALAEALRKGETVVVTPTGEVATQDTAQRNGLSGINPPDGKLAGEHYFSI